MRDGRFKRVFICAEGIDRPLLQSAARLAALVPAADLHVVAGTAPAVLDTLPGAVAEAFGRLAGRIRLQLVPEPSLRAFQQLARIEEADLMVVPASVTDRDGRLLRHAPCATMSLPASTFADSSRGVLALVDWPGAIPTLSSAIELARRMRRPRVTACHVYFNEAAIVSDEWEAREAQRRRHAMDLLVARVACGDVDIETHVIQCPDAERALQRPEVPQTPDLLVTNVPVRARVPVLQVQIEADSRTLAQRRPAWSLFGRGTESEPA